MFALTFTSVHDAASELALGRYTSPGPWLIPFGTQTLKTPFGIPTMTSKAYILVWDQLRS